MLRAQFILCNQMVAKANGTLSFEVKNGVVKNKVKKNSGGTTIKIYIDKINENAKVSLGLAIGEKVLNILWNKDGYEYCKNKLEMCWLWLKGEYIEIDEFLDCLDSPTLKDLVYYTSNESNPIVQQVYGIFIEIVSYTAVQAIDKAQAGGVPEYLEEVDDNYLLSLINLVLKLGYFKEEDMNRVIEYLESKYLVDSDIQHSNISKEEIVNILM